MYSFKRIVFLSREGCNNVDFAKDTGLEVLIPQCVILLQDCLQVL